MSSHAIDAAAPQKQALLGSDHARIARAHAQAALRAFEHPLLGFVLAAAVWSAPLVALACSVTPALLIELPTAFLRGDSAFLLGLGALLAYLFAATWLLAATASRLLSRGSRILRWALHLAVAPVILVSLAATVALTFTLSFAMIVRTFPALL
ncbi:MAG TPA: hypothetical protein VMG55_04120 [Stellaceae bacterium]|nr:hypothetical protein [Stellaceae bacterium]